MTADVAARLDDDGRIASLVATTSGARATRARPGYAGVPGLLAGAHLADAAARPAGRRPARRRPAAAAPATRVPLYDVGQPPHHRPPADRRRRSAPRRCASLGAYLNVFAIESFMDELAAAAGADPLAFRLAHLTDERGAAGARRGRRGGRLGRAAARGRRAAGIGFARYKDTRRLVRGRRRGRGRDATSGSAG